MGVGIHGSWWNFDQKNVGGGKQLLRAFCLFGSRMAFFCAKKKKI